LLRQRCSWRPMRAALSPESICRSMAAVWPCKQFFYLCSSTRPRAVLVRRAAAGFPI
jgi:hypothetical protein